MHERKEIRGAKQFEALSLDVKEELDKVSFIEGFVYGVVDTERKQLIYGKKVLP